MDLFFDKSINSFTIPIIQDFLNQNTRDFILNSWGISQEFISIISFNSNLSLTSTSFNSTDLENTSLLQLSTNIINEMFFLTQPKNELFNLIDVVPEHDDTFEIFEIISVNVDNSLYEFIHLPEFKLYYPEPFIASPSFVHEELWFIHILHYQH